VFCYETRSFAFGEKKQRVGTWETVVHNGLYYEAWCRVDWATLRPLRVSRLADFLINLLCGAQRVDRPAGPGSEEASRALYGPGPRAAPEIPCMVTRSFWCTLACLRSVWSLSRVTASFPSYSWAYNLSWTERERPTIFFGGDKLLL
jgi:hypothetical protein